MLKHIDNGVILAVLVASAACFGLAGCAVESISYPTLSTPKKLTKRLLSRDEQEEVIRNLSAEQARHKDSAINAIEKTP